MALPLTGSLPRAGVYAIRNTVTGRVYVGSTLNLEKRWAGHLTYFRTGRHSNAMQRDWQAYGAATFVFTPLEEVEADELSLQVAEQRWLDTISADLLYNRARKAGRPLKRMGQRAPVLQALAAWIGSQRENGETDSDLAERLGISRSHWRHIQAGRRTITLDIARAAVAIWPAFEDLYISEIRAQLHAPATPTASANAKKAS